MSRRKPLTGRSGGSSNQPARDRRDSQASAQGESFEFPLRTNRRGRVELVRSEIGAIGLDPSRGIGVIVHAPLALMPGSPYGITLPLEKETMRVVKGKLAARLSAEQIAAMGGTVADELERLRLNKENKIEKGQPNGYTPLGADGLVPPAFLPPLSSLGDAPGIAMLFSDERGDDHMMWPPGGQAGGVGPAGPAGATGAAGPIGPATHLLSNDSGEAERGFPGLRGPAGATGAPGPALAFIFENTDGEQGFPGRPGTTGPAGPAGQVAFLLADGDEGPAGPPSRALWNPQLDALARTVSAPDKAPYFTSYGHAGTYDISATGRTFLSAGSAAGERDLLQLGSDMRDIVVVGTGVADIRHPIGVRTGVGATTRAFLANDLVAVKWTPSAKAYYGPAVVDLLSVLVTAGGGVLSIGIWEELDGWPDRLRADSGDLTASGVVDFAAGFTPTPGLMYFVGFHLDTNTTLRAFSANAVEPWGWDAGLGTAPYTFLLLNMTYGGGLPDPFPHGTPTTGNQPAFFERYA